MFHTMNYFLTSTIAAYSVLFHLPQLFYLEKTTCFSLLNDIAYRGINKRIDPDDMNDYHVDDTLQFW